MYTKIYEEKYPRKATEYSLWVCDGIRTSATSFLEESRGVKKLVCLHPRTPYRPIVELVAKAFDSFMRGVGAEEAILKAKEELP